jgi:hypothetical protein
MILPVGATSFGTGLYHLGFDGTNAENLFAAGAARKILQGTQGSFMSVGMTFLVATVSAEQDCACGAAGTSESEVTGGFGVILRPLPVFSFGYSIDSFHDIEYDTAGSGSMWRTTNRWGISYFWEERVVISYEQEHRADEVVRHYGFSVRASLPFEMMAGFSDGRVSGGIGVLFEKIRFTAAFTSSEDLGINARASLEIFLHGTGTDR